MGGGGGEMWVGRWMDGWYVMGGGLEILAWTDVGGGGGEMDGWYEMEGGLEILAWTDVGGGGGEMDGWYVVGVGIGM